MWRMTAISRRDFVALTTAGALATPFVLRDGVTRAAGALTAQDVVDRIKKNVGVEWTGDGIDTFKAGDPATAVTGVVVTSMATLDVLRKAAAAGANLVVTAAPTFYSRADLRGLPAPGAGRAAFPSRGSGPGGAPPPSPATQSGPGTGASAPMPPAPPLPQSVVPPPQRGAAAAASPPPPDPVYSGKNAFIDTHKLVVFRLSQHWNQRKPDPRALGVAAAMGWEHKASEDALRYDVSAITLEALVGQLKKTLGTRGGIRVIGDRRTTVRKIGLLPGFTVIKDAIAMLPDVDVLITGEVQEWESATYAQDVVFAGVKKGFVSIGRVVNEAAGMQVCAGWLKTVVPEVPVRFVPAGDPYWRPL